MNDCIRMKTLVVHIQENGIIRNENGYLIGRLSDDIDFYGEHIIATNLNCIKEQMSLLSSLRCSFDDTYYIDLEYDRLEKQLKELEDE